MKALGLTGALIVALLPTAIAAEEIPSEPVGEVVQVDDATLRELISDRRLIRPGIKAQFPMYEQFHADGRYVRGLDLGRDEGRFTITNGQLCVTGLAPHCRTAYKDAVGRFFLKRAEPDAPYLWYRILDVLY